MEITKRPLTGRTKILTDEEAITRDNIISVLRKAYSEHLRNAAEIQFLFDYEAGVQPLPYVKVIRPEIDIRTTDNLASYVTEFNKGYFWGAPALYTQRGNVDHHGTDTTTDSVGISALNEMMLNGALLGGENQILADYVEKGGVGHRLVLPRTDWENPARDGVYADIHTLDSRYAFCVYNNGVGQKKLVGVTYAKRKGGTRFTCYTASEIFEVQKNKLVGEPRANLMGMIPIVEYERSPDRTGCFERQVKLMDNLNSMVSNFANDVAQGTQEIWWGNDIDFPVDERTGETKAPKSGQWLLTRSTEGASNQKVQPLSSSLDRSATLDSINETRNEILKLCFVPMQYGSEGGGSTGVATDTMSGWNATAVAAARKEQTISMAAREELALLLKALSLAPESQLPADDPIRQVHLTDIDIHFTRQKNYDLGTMANAFATFVSHGVDGRQSLKLIDRFDDVEQVWLDSKDGIKAYQESVYGNRNEAGGTGLQDESGQSGNSPAIGGLATADSPAVG